MHIRHVSAAILTVAAIASGHAAVVANAGVKADALGKDDLKSILLGNKISWDGGGKVVLCIQSGPLHEQIVETYTGKSASAFTAHWKKLVFTGKAGMPAAFAKDEDVLAQIAKTEGAIGYVADGTALPAGVKLITIQ